MNVGCVRSAMFPYARNLLLSLAMVGCMISSGYAAQVFAGQWRSYGSSPIFLGVVQHGETVAIFSKSGYAMALLSIDGGGMLATGEGRWSFNDLSPQPVSITVGYEDDRLYLSIVSKSARVMANLFDISGLASEKWRGFLELKGNRNAEAEEFYQRI